MLNSDQLDKIKEFLDRSVNPLFFFDNDVDGLTSFLLLRRYAGKGKGVAIKSYPELSESYSRKLHEFNPDVVFVLDKNSIAREFIQTAEELNCPIVWIDHHPPINLDEIRDKLDKIVFYFNPIKHDEKNEPTSYLCYNAVKNKEDEWIALIGCLADWFIPEFAKDFSEKNPLFFPYTEDPAKAFFTTPAGKIVKVLSFALKDRTTNIVKMLRVLIELKNYNEFSEENQKVKQIYHRFQQINKKYEKILERAKTIGKCGQLLFFKYGGQFSLSSDLANELFYLNQDKMVVVAYTRGIKANVSIRGWINIKEIACNALRGIESTCGGHKNACGATLNVDDIPRFKRNLLKELK